MNFNAIQLMNGHLFLLQICLDELDVKIHELKVKLKQKQIKQEL